MFKIGIDVGGTFTDFVVDSEGEPPRYFKTPSTPHDPSEGVMTGLEILGRIKNRGHYGTRSWPDEYDSKPDDFMVPLVADVDKLVLVVAGGDGRHSSWFPAWSATQRAVEII